ncbi:hypothetical protein CRYPA_1912 [uncultured Candidatus Thioglobus sp.]|nr:hypothetical protein CRYPA_1912 [uncultured Candidatus Thioglobus sp.]
MLYFDLSLVMSPNSETLAEQMAQEKLEKYLKIISENLYYAIESVSILKSIASKGKEIESLNYGNFFFPLQRVLKNDIILSLSKIFENNKQSINFNKVQNYLSCNQRLLPLEQNFLVKLDRYKTFDFSDLQHELETRSHEKQISIYSLKSFLKCLDENIKKFQKEYKYDLLALKEFRDKNITHSDEQKIQNKTTWGRIDRLIEFVKEYIDMISFAFLSIAHSGDNTSPFSLTSSCAKRASGAFERLIKNINK